MDMYIVAGVATLATVVAVLAAIGMLRLQRAMVEYEVEQTEIMELNLRAIRAQADVIDSLLQRADATDTELDGVHAYGNSLASTVNAQRTEINGLLDRADRTDKDLDATNEYAAYLARVNTAQAAAIKNLVESVDAIDKELDEARDYVRELTDFSTESVLELRDRINVLIGRADATDKELGEALVFAQSITMVTESVISTIERNEREQSGVIQDILITIVDLIASNSLEGTMRLDGMEFTAYDLNSDEAANKIKAKLMSNDLEKIESLDHEQLSAQLERLFAADIKAATEKEQQAHKEATFRSMFKHDEDGGNA